MVYYLQPIYLLSYPSSECNQLMIGHDFYITFKSSLSLVGHQIILPKKLLKKKKTTYDMCTQYMHDKHSIVYIYICMINILPTHIYTHTHTHTHTRAHSTHSATYGHCNTLNYRLRDVPLLLQAITHSVHYMHSM